MCNTKKCKYLFSIILISFLTLVACSKDDSKKVVGKSIDNISGIEQEDTTDNIIREDIDEAALSNTVTEYENTDSVDETNDMDNLENYIGSWCYIDNDSDTATFVESIRINRIEGDQVYMDYYEFYDILASYDTNHNRSVEVMTGESIIGTVDYTTNTITANYDISGILHLQFGDGCLYDTAMSADWRSFTFSYGLEEEVDILSSIGYNHLGIYTNGDTILCISGDVETNDIYMSIEKTGYGLYQAGRLSLLEENKYEYISETGGLVISINDNKLTVEESSVPLYTNGTEYVETGDFQKVSLCFDPE